MKQDFRVASKRRRFLLWRFSDFVSFDECISSLLIKLYLSSSIKFSGTSASYLKIRMLVTLITMLMHH